MSATEIVYQRFRLPEHLYSIINASLLVFVMSAANSDLVRLLSFRR